MIAPVKDTPPIRRPSAIQAARLAVADALLSPHCRTKTGDRSTARRTWFLVGSMIVMAVIYLLAINWWTSEG
jgi:hypothetical protein